MIRTSSFAFRGNARVIFALVLRLDCLCFFIFLKSRFYIVWSVDTSNTQVQLSQSLAVSDLPTFRGGRGAFYLFISYIFCCVFDLIKNINCHHVTLSCPLF